MAPVSSSESASDSTRPPSRASSVTAWTSPAPVRGSVYSRLPLWPRATAGASSTSVSCTYLNAVTSSPEAVVTLKTTVRRPSKDISGVLLGLEKETERSAAW